MNTVSAVKRISDNSVIICSSMGGLDRFDLKSGKIIGHFRLGEVKSMVEVQLNGKPSLAVVTR